MSSVKYSREFENERLAAEEKIGVFEKTIVKYEEETDLDVNVHRTELTEQHVCKEEEEEEEEEAPPTDLQLWNQERNSSLDPEDPDPPQIKEEPEELCISQEGEQLVLKQEADTFTLTPTCADSEDQTLVLNPDGTVRAAQTESVVHMPVIISVVSEANGELQLIADGSPDQTRGKHDAHHNTNAGSQSFICDTCGKDCKYKSVFQRHLRIHTGEKPYLCKTCEKRFSYMSSLKKHTRIHTGEKPYVCKTCGKDFRLSDELLLHMRRAHTGEKLHSPDPDPPHAKEEPEEACGSPEGGQLVLKQEAETCFSNPAHEGSDQSEYQTLYLIVMKV